MDLKLNGEEGDMSTFVLNGEWALLGMLTIRNENASFSVFTVDPKHEHVEWFRQKNLLHETRLTRYNCCIAGYLADYF